MDDATRPRERMRSHRLTAPAADPVAAARHMLATQAQEFWGGRWALAVRSSRAPGLSRLDAAFDDGRLVRSWTMRGTIHICPAEDLGWLLGITGERQLRSAASRHRQLEIDADARRRAERAVRSALRGGGRLTRAEVAGVLERVGERTAGQRGLHLLQSLSLRGIVCHGPVVPRPGAVTREQYIVLSEEWITDPVTPVDPLAELFVRYIDGHGPATAADFAWWTGLPLGVARTAAAAAEGRVTVADHDVPLYASIRAPRPDPRRPEVVALPAFDEYYISYADRSAAATTAHRALIGPGANGMVRPTILVRGRIVGVWTHSRAVGRDDAAARAELFPAASGADPVDEVAVRAALDRYAEFIRG
ncbi:winged helix DNA-binding domain-containing protein [Microbacterium caowuchunii]|uniref:Winged helix DNA-binding domain-containing protein n=1 Tax=Microbacterium caowuchunii TaxID=2614638 RepID=A0A5N0TM81_9MICO|nr:winged helix DNA-binding domain-containing protein [Microbacterium caowuchunii]KAA9135434.1 winged helix DNA-binding domain-containing protein [Microbacterium caowuchunii]